TVGGIPADAVRIQPAGEPARLLAAALRELEILGALHAALGVPGTLSVADNQDLHRGPAMAYSMRGSWSTSTSATKGSSTAQRCTGRRGQRLPPTRQSTTTVAANRSP